MKKVWYIIKTIVTEGFKEIKYKIWDSGRISRLDRDFCIRALKYGDDHREGFTLDEMKKGLKLNNEQTEYVRILAKRGEVFYTETYSDGVTTYTRYLMTFQDKFRLMQYLELKEAMKSSSTALKVAIFSIVISTIVSILSVIVGLSKITS